MQICNKECGTVYLVALIVLVAIFWIAALTYFLLLKETNSDVSFIIKLKILLQETASGKEKES